MCPIFFVGRNRKSRQLSPYLRLWRYSWPHPRHPKTLLDMHAVYSQWKCAQIFAPLRQIRPCLVPCCKDISRLASGMAGQTETLMCTLMDWIDLGHLNPGDVSNEIALVVRFGVLCTPPREAVLRLKSMGLARSLPCKGATVFRPTLKEFLATACAI